MPDLTDAAACDGVGMRLAPTMEDTLGPYYPAVFARSFAAPPAPRDGERIRLAGTIRDMHGAPVAAAIVETWPGGATDPGAGFARHHVVDGRYAVVLPPRAPHVTLTLFCDGIARLVTRLFLDGEPSNASDPLLSALPERLRTRLIARRVGDGGTARYEHALILRGRDETPFFDDLATPPGRGRRLRIGVTDETSAARTPMRRLRSIPRAAMASFVPPAVTIPRLSPGENDLTRRAPGAPPAAGTPVAVEGRVVDRRGRPRCGVLIEIWTANAHGRYDHPDDPARAPLDPRFAGLGRAVTDADGRYRFLTVRPAPYLARADIDRWRPAHIHLSLIGAGTRLVTQLYFPDDPLHAGDPGLLLMGDAAARQIASPIAPAAADAVARFAFDIVVGGAAAARRPPEAIDFERRIR